MKANKSSLLLLGAAIGVALMTLFRLPGSAASAQEGKQPFASSIEQRQEIVAELRKLNGLMQKQIDLLTSGKVRVVVVEAVKEDGAEKRNR